MATIHFFCKLGCINNNKQKRLLKDAGHSVMDYDILHFEFNKETLRSFFGDKPVTYWFNPTAPAIKNGEVHPEKMGEEEALQAMIQDRLLIKRPLIQIGSERFCGFTSNRVRTFAGLDVLPGEEDGVAALLEDDLVTCSNLKGMSCIEKEAGNG